MKKRFSKVLPIVTAAVLLSACGNSDAGDQIANIVQAEDKHVLGVKGGTPNVYPDKTYEEAFGNFFGSPTWKYFVGTKEGPDEDGDGKPDYTEDNVDIVEFTGYCTYQGVKVKALVQFTLSKEDDTFEATYLSFNEVPQSGLMLSALLEAAFTDGDISNDIKETSVKGGSDKVIADQNVDSGKPVFPLVTSSDAEKVFQEWEKTHPLGGPCHLSFISDNSTDSEGNEAFLFTLEGVGMFNMTIRKSDGYMEYIEKFGSMSMDRWYEECFVNKDDVPVGYEDDVPYGYEDNYLDYQAWGGAYDGGWMDTTLWLALYSDGSQDPGCGYLTANFRGNESTGKLYFLGGASFRWEEEGYYEGAPITTHYILATSNGGICQLELYDANWVHEVTFTQYEQYIP